MDDHHCWIWIAGHSCCSSEQVPKTSLRSQGTFLAVVATQCEIALGDICCWILKARHIRCPFEQVPNTSFRSQGTFLAVVATKCERSDRYSLFNFLKARHIYAALKVPNTFRSEGSFLAVVATKWETSAAEAHTYCPVSRTGPGLFPFTRNVPCSHGNQVRNSSCSSGRSSLLYPF